MFSTDLPDLAARLAQEVCTLLNQTDEPYRSRLAAYIRRQTLRTTGDLEHGLRAWFDTFEPQAMLEHYQPLYSLAKLTQEKFPRRER